MTAPCERCGATILVHEPHRHECPQMPARFELDLTKDELTILRYVVPDGRHGDPLKDTYELGKDEPEDPYAVLKTLYAKICKLRWPERGPRQ